MKFKIENVFGLLKRPCQRPVTLEEMQDAVENEAVIAAQSTGYPDNPVLLSFLEGLSLDGLELIREPGQGRDVES